MRVFVGIDPGLDGAVAFLFDDGTPPMLFDTPTLELRKGKTTRRVVDAAAMASLLGSCSNPRHVFIEDVHAMKGQGVASMFNFGLGFGTWLGILAALKLPYDRVAPQRWKKAMMAGMLTEKDASIARAKQLFPEAADQLKRKKDDGRAEALLLAEYGRRTTSAEAHKEASHESVTTAHG